MRLRHKPKRNAWRRSELRRDYGISAADVCADSGWKRLPFVCPSFSDRSLKQRHPRSKITGNTAPPSGRRAPPWKADCAIDMLQIPIPKGQPPQRLLSGDSSWPEAATESPIVGRPWWLCRLTQGTLRRERHASCCRIWTHHIWPCSPHHSGAARPIVEPRVPYAGHYGALRLPTQVFSLMFARYRLQGGAALQTR